MTAGRGGVTMKIDEKWLFETEACPEIVEWWRNQKETDGLKVVKALIEAEKLDWANWTIVRIMEYKQYVSYAVFTAEQVLDVFEKKYPDDKRPRTAIEAAKKCVNDPSDENKKAAATAASVYSDGAPHAALAAYAAAHAAAHAYAATAAYAVAYAALAAYTVVYAVDATYAYAVVYAVDATAAKKEENLMRLKILNYGIFLLYSRSRIGGQKCVMQNIMGSQWNPIRRSVRTVRAYRHG